MNAPHAPKVAGIDSTVPSPAHTASPVSVGSPAAAVPLPSSAPTCAAGPGVLLQDRLAGWVSDLTTLHELTERLCRTDTLPAALDELLRAGAALVGARRGLVVLEPLDGPVTTTPLGLDRADLGHLETVPRAALPHGRLLDDPALRELTQPDLLTDPTLDPRHREVATRLGYAATYALRLDGDPPTETPGTTFGRLTGRSGPTEGNGGRLNESSGPGSALPGGTGTGTRAGRGPENPGVPDGPRTPGVPDPSRVPGTLRPTGASGTPGAPGRPGVTDAPGLYGTLGSAGVPGLHSAPGEPSASGAAGVDDPTRAPDTTGGPGALGPDHAFGSPGAPGALRAADVTGTTGSPGVSDALGAGHAPGFPGAPGAPGAPGMIGAPGLPGTADVTGAAGLHGTLGPAGAPGAFGPGHVPGAPGMIGASGLPGAADATGAAGPHGTLGPASTPGSPSTGHVSGSAGVSGAPGVVGFRGGTEGSAVPGVGLFGAGGVRSGFTGAVVWLYDEAGVPDERRRHLVGLYVRFAGVHVGRLLEVERMRACVGTVAEELLPARLPRVAGMRLAVRHRSGVRGGGDWYDALPLPDAALGLAVGSVTGSGPSAVAAMGRLRASLRAYAVMEGEDPVAVLSDLELLLRLTEPARAATALFAYCEPGPRKITLAGAGHCPPLLTGERRTEFVETSVSAPLGMLSCWEAPSVDLEAAPGETVLLYTDGLLRRTGEPIDRAFNRLHSAAAGIPRALRDDPGAIADHVLRAMLPAGADDDVTEDVVLLAARFD